MLSKRALLNDRASRFEPAFSQPWRYNEMLADNILQTTALSWDNWQLDLKFHPWFCRDIQCKLFVWWLDCLLPGLNGTLLSFKQYFYKWVPVSFGCKIHFFYNMHCNKLCRQFFFFFWQSTISGAKMRKRSFMQHQSPWACWKCDGNFSLFLETKETYIMHSKVTFECILHTAWLLRCPFWQNSLSKFRTKKLIL